MLERLRIYPQLIFGGVLSSVVIWSMFSKVTATDLITLPFALAFLIGGILAFRHLSIANWLLLLGSLGPLALGSFFHYARIDFIIKNSGMEGPNGHGSPLAFLIGWVFTTLIFFIPGLLFTIWNFISIRKSRTRRLS